jgi:hypothetical protein
VKLGEGGRWSGEGYIPQKGRSMTTFTASSAPHYDGGDHVTSLSQSGRPARRGVRCHMTVLSCPPLGQ